MSDHQEPPLKLLTPFLVTVAGALALAFYYIGVRLEWF